MSVRAMNWAVEVSKTTRLTSSQRLVLYVLAHHHHDKTNACFPAVDTIAACAGLSRRRVQAALRELAELRLISCEKRTERGRQRSNQYDLFGRFRGDAISTPKRETRGAGGDAPQEYRGVTPATPDRDINSLEARQQSTEIIAFPKQLVGR